MKKLLYIMLFMATPVLAEVFPAPIPAGLLFCSDVDPTVCVLLTPGGDIYKRQPPVGRRAIDYDMQNWQYAKDNIMSLPDGDERDTWERDSLYWQTRLLADKAFARLAASILPPAFVTTAGLEKYREQYTEAAELVLYMEAFYGLPVNDPVGAP